MSGFNDGLKRPVSGGGGAAAETVDLIAGETITAGQLVYQAHGAAGTQGRVYLTDSGTSYSSNKAAVIGIATTSAEAAASVTVQYTGVVSGLSGLTANLVYSPSSTPGALAANGEEPMVGIAESATELRLTGVVSGLSGLTNGVAYGSNASGVLTAGKDESIGYAISATELWIRTEYGATKPQTSLFTPAPTVYYRFDSDPGDATAVDSSVNGLDGTLPAGSYNYVTSTVGSAPRTVLDWTSTTGQFALPALPVPPGDDKTISFWHRPIVSGAYNYTFSHRSPTNTGNSGSGLWTRLNYRRPQLNQGVQVSSSTTTPNFAWAHICFVFGGTTGTIYLNGAQVGQSTSITPRARPSAAGGNTFFGYTESPGTPASWLYSSEGLYCDLMIIDAAIPATGSNSVATLYNGGTPPNLV